MRKGVSSRRRIEALAITLGGAAAVAGALTVRALRQWSSLESPEKIVALDGAEQLRVPSPDGAELAVFAARGQGGGPDSRTVILVHGWTNDSRIWTPVALRLLSKGHTVVAYDLRGHGQSTVGSDGFSLGALADDLWSVLETVGAREAILVGHSLGGMTVQAFVTLHPDKARQRVSGIVLVATSSGRVIYPALAKRVAPWVMASPLVDRALRADPLGTLLVRRSLGKAAPRSQLDAIRQMFVATPPEVRTGLLETISALDLTEDLPNVDIPVTVVAGERDTLLPRYHARRIAQLVPGSRLVEIKDSGHMVPIEAPERLAEIIEEAFAVERPTQAAASKWREAPADVERVREGGSDGPVGSEGDQRTTA